MRTWLETETRLYDVIMLDPPSFSNSKGQSDFDVQADQMQLLTLAMAPECWRRPVFFNQPTAL